MYLLIPAAGMGKRMGSSRNKLLLELKGKPLLAWTLISADKAESIEWIGIMGQTYDFPTFEEIINQIKPCKPIKLIKGEILVRNLSIMVYKHCQKKQKKS